MPGPLNAVSAQPTLGIVAALPAEARTLGFGRLSLGAVHEPLPGVLLSRSGVGAAAATRCARALVAAGAQALLSWGSAGALAAGLAPGCLLVPERVCAAGRSFEVDAQWRRALLAAVGGVAQPLGGTLVQSPGLLSAAAAKRDLGLRHGAQATDMESGALAAVAQESGVRFLIVRAVADPVSLTLPSAIGAALDADGRVRSTRVLAHALLRPGQWRTLLRLARAFAAARATLVSVSRCAGPRFGLERLQP